MRFEAPAFHRGFETTTVAGGGPGGRSPPRMSLDTYAIGIDEALPHEVIDPGDDVVELAPTRSRLFALENATPRPVLPR